MKLVIAEKYSVGKSIAAVLNANQRENGFFYGKGYIVASFMVIGCILTAVLLPNYIVVKKIYRQAELKKMNVDDLI
jgi:DNA topoisomerase IA